MIVRSEKLGSSKKDLCSLDCRFFSALDCAIVKADERVVDCAESSLKRCIGGECHIKSMDVTLLEYSL